MIDLRPATIDDAEFLFSLKNDPLTLKFAIKTHNKIKWEDHLKWVKKHLKEIQIIGFEYEPLTYVTVGSVRINPEIAIVIDKKYRGKNIAYRVLKSIIKPGMIARIVEGNISSMRLFVRLGFSPVEYKKGYYIFKQE